MRLIALVVLLVGCGRAELLRPLSVRGEGARAGRSDAGHVAQGVDAGVDAGVIVSCDQGPFGVDCCEGGRRVTSASCVQGVQVCEVGSICTCEGVPQNFNCVDFCGTDAFVGPTCLNGEWACGAGLKRSSECPAETCWGSPGDCCVAPACVDGAWTCQSISC